MTPEKSRRLQSIIQQLDVCEKGKAKVTELVEELLGDKLVAPEPEFKPKVGDVVQLDGSRVVILKTYSVSQESKCYFLAGYDGCVEPFSNTPYTYSELLNYLKNRKSRIVGRVEQVLFPTK